MTTAAAAETVASKTEAAYVEALRARDALAERMDRARYAEPPDRRDFAIASKAHSVAERELAKAMAEREEARRRAAFASGAKKALDRVDSTDATAVVAADTATQTLVAAIEAWRPTLAAAHAASAAERAALADVSVEARLGLQLLPKAHAWDGVAPTASVAEIAQHLATLLVDSAFRASMADNTAATPNANKPWPKEFNLRKVQVG